MATASVPELADVEVDRLIRRLATLPAVLPLVAVPDALGLANDDAADALGTLASLGLADCWESPLGPAVTLTALAAERLGLELQTDEERDPERQSGARDLRWIGRGTARSEHARLLLIDHATGAPPGDDNRGVIENIADPKATDPAKDPSNFKVISDPGWCLLGFSSAWSPALEASAPCAVCRGRRLPWRGLCLGCLRSVRDNTLEPVKPLEVEPPALEVETVEVKPKPVEVDGLAGGIGPAKPRAKRPPKPVPVATGPTPLELLRRGKQKPGGWTTRRANLAKSK